MRHRTTVTSRHTRPVRTASGPLVDTAPHTFDNITLVPHEFEARAKESRDLVLKIMNGNPDVFGTVRSIEIEGRKVSTGTPFSIKDYVFIPLFIETEGKNRLVFAYQSKGHACWRRFAGHDAMNFYKGIDENNQTIDWRIQKLLDSVYADNEPKDLRLKRRKVTTHDLTFIQRPLYDPIFRGIEDTWQLSMIVDSAIQPELYKPGLDGKDKPARVVDFWWTEKSAYGRHVNILVESASGDFLYVFGITEHTLILKYIQNLHSKDIIETGSPEMAVMLEKDMEWILAPELEHTGQAHKAPGAHRGTIREGGRVEIIGLHNDEKSPFFQFNNAISDIPLLLFGGHYQEVEAKLANMKDGDVPAATEKQFGVEIEWWLDVQLARLDFLKKVYRRYASNRITMDGLRALGLNEGDIEVFKRYKRKIKKADEYGRREVERLLYGSPNPWGSIDGGALNNRAYIWARYKIFMRMREIKKQSPEMADHDIERKANIDLLHEMGVEYGS